MLDIVIQARAAALNPAVQVKRILPFRQRRMVGPFIFMDHAGPIFNPPPITSSMDVLPHPHIGLSKVSYLFGGQVTHRDSLGVEQVSCKSREKSRRYAVSKLGLYFRKAYIYYLIGNQSR